MKVTFQIPIVDFRSMMPGTNRLPIELYYRNGGDDPELLAVVKKKLKKLTDKLLQERRFGLETSEVVA